MASIQIGNASAAPTDPNQQWGLGDIVINSNPTANGILGWINTVAGYTGTWAPIGVISHPSLQTLTATSGTLSAAQSMILLNPASGSSYSLPLAASYAPGADLFIKQIANNSVTLTPLGANGYDSAAITLTQNQAITLRSNGLTNWYKQA